MIKPKNSTCDDRKSWNKIFIIIPELKIIFELCVYKYNYF